MKFHASVLNDNQFSQQCAIPPGTWKGWRAKEAKILASRRHGSLATLGGQGRKSLFPFKDDLQGYMRDRRTKEKYLRVFHLILWNKRNHRPWLLQYIESKATSPSDTFSAVFVRQVVLDDVWAGYVVNFWTKYEAYDKLLIYNADETGVYFDMPPGKTLVEVGKSSKVDKKNKHSERISVVLTVRADDVKLPLLFIIKGQPGGLLEKTELPSYDPTHVYAVQANAWMDERVWNIYLERLFAQHVQDASVLLVDNLECHVSEASYDKTEEAMFSVIEPLPPNSTSRCQPLDVGVMGPFKAMLKTEWLLEDTESADENMTAEQKRRATIGRTIRVWDKISSETIVSSFEKSVL
ncbi:hypothetical protein DYB34_014064 [Aphanomyces astaci]|uniref:DDE-1 domain-containing protein n=1 Tax=Aphanomyces astaci TaxID=112090 RepID=A0A397F8C4_APHAT|nr:hypothetical protein DYB34_014064 [Aphanomyces astaci]RHZ20102.1 hypothetical protein DYB31_006557 [Aphanomyces astaci]